MLLILTICTALSVCRVETVPTEAVLPAQCTAAAMEWIMEHPQYTLQRWTCKRRENAA